MVPNGSFANQTMYSTGSDPQSIAVGDFNNDTLLDIVVANWGSNDVSVFFGYGNGSFANQMTYSTGTVPISVAAGDFNNDTQLNVVVANFGSGNVGVFLGYGNGSFSNQTMYSTGSGSDPYFVAVGDFNNDIILDIVVADHGVNNLEILLGHGDGTFANPILFLMEYGSGPFFVVVGDFNNDIKLDFAVAKDGTDSLTILLQTC